MLSFCVLLILMRKMLIDVFFDEIIGDNTTLIIIYTLLIRQKNKYFVCKY